MIIWLTGNTDSGKTTLAESLYFKMSNDTIILDGDDMRTVWNDLKLSKADRYENNFRIARLARIIDNQGHDVIVAVIAPYKELRENIDKLIPDTKWVYVRRGSDGLPNPEKPYEIPESPLLVVQPEKQTPEEEADEVLKAVDYFS